MDLRFSQDTILDYCQALDRKQIQINRDYQRGVVWPPIAQAFLIESIILGYPVPKLSLYQKTDITSLKTIKEIVDGHQRTFAIQRFFQDELRLSKNLETPKLAGRKFSELDDEERQAFLTYGLNLDLFVGTTDAEVREVFRRMNTYTVTLNPEEQRHARYQGLFKWFVHRLGEKFSEPFLQMGVFTQKQLVRMADTKLITEVCDALRSGIRTTNSRHLDRLYYSRDRTFDEEADLDEKIGTALDQILEWESIHDTRLMRHYVLYALILAIIHTHDSIEGLRGIVDNRGRTQIVNDVATSNLERLASELEDPQEPSPYQDFVNACSGKTNVKAQRETRFRWMCRALVAESL